VGSSRHRHAGRRAPDVETARRKRAGEGVKYQGLADRHRYQARPRSDGQGSPRDRVGTEPSPSLGPRRGGAPSGMARAHGPATAAVVRGKQKASPAKPAKSRTWGQAATTANPAGRAGPGRWYPASMTTAELTRFQEAEEALSASLAKYVGRWVAVRDHEVIADAATAAGADRAGERQEVRGDVRGSRVQRGWLFLLKGKSRRSSAIEG